MRNLKAADLPSLERILRATGAFTEAEVACAMELLEIVSKDPRQQDYQVAVAEEGGAVVGYILYGPVPLTEGNFDVYWIATDPAVQGKGFGQRLLFYAERRCPNPRGTDGLPGDLLPGKLCAHPPFLRPRRLSGGIPYS